MTRAQKVPDIAALIGSKPRLRNPACRGNPEPLWDLQVVSDTPWERVRRYRRAAAICARCPARNDCAPIDDDDGIYAGRLHIKGHPVPPVTCAWPRCGLVFITTDPGFEYCSESCRRGHRRDTGKTDTPEVPEVPAVGLSRCQNPGCGQPIDPQRQARGARNCSTRCSRQASRKRAREAAA